MNKAKQGGNGKTPSGSSAKGRRRNERYVAVTGGAGFIGTNLAHRLLSEGRRVVILDNLSRPGVEHNLAWLYERHGDGVAFEHEDVRDAAAVRRVVCNAEAVFHLAAQVAVTTSLETPLEDFEVNVHGTLNVLEALRSCDEPPALVFTSTNKVYGDLADVLLKMDGQCYAPRDADVAAKGVDETRRLDFHSPYGCSKGAADQYVLDYVRSYGLPAVVFRMSCIYGPHQFGTEDQGWVAHFLIRALAGDAITLYGDGRQVRDILFVDDLVEAFLLAEEHMESIAGRAFNMGGGRQNAVSLLGVLDAISAMREAPVDVEFGPWRTGDQRYYVSNAAAFSEAVGWKPKVRPEEGLQILYDWLVDNSDAHEARCRDKSAAVAAVET